MTTHVQIPGDWNGEDWTCVQIQWPNSEKWLSLLAGLIITPTKGRYYDEESGDIRAAQSVGREIYWRNIPFVACRTLADCPDCPDEASRENCAKHGFGGSIVIEEENDMGQVVTDVKIVDGEIRVYFGHCCYDVLDLSQVVIQGGDFDGVGPDPLNPGGDPDFVYSACGKAWAIVRAIYAVLSAGYDATTETDWPWQILGHIEQAVGYNLDNKWMAALLVDWVTYGAGGLGLSPTDVFSAQDQQTSVCALVNLFADDEIGVPDNDAYEAVKSAIHTRNFLYDGLIMTAIACLGRGNLDTIAKLGAGDVGQNCDCPQELFPAFGTSLEWYHIIDFRLSSLPEGYVFNGANDHHAPGVGLWAENGLTDYKTSTGIQIPYDAVGGSHSITKIGMRIIARGDENWEDTTVPLSFTGGGLIAYAKLAQVTGDNPAIAGTHELININQVSPIPVAAGLGNIQVSLSAFHPGLTPPPEDVIETSSVVVAIAIGGIGVDPWPELP